MPLLGILLICFTRDQSLASHLAIKHTVNEHSKNPNINASAEPIFPISLNFSGWVVCSSRLKGLEKQIERLF
jgi:hypothetical protein